MEQKFSLGLIILMLFNAGQLKAQYTPPILPDETRDARMEWYREARFGLFIHWGLYSILAGEWNGEPCKGNYAEHIMRLNRIPYAEYSQTAKQFNPLKFDPDKWAQLAQNAGMGYFVLTTKHHDGFAMYDSDVSDYNVVDATPYGKDVFAQLAESFRKKGMRVGVYYSQDADWSVEQGKGGLYNTWDFDPGDGPEAFDRYFYGKSLPQIKEVATRYGKIDLFWFDVPRMIGKDRGKVLLDLVREYQPDAVLSGRVARPYGLYSDYITPGDNGYLTSPQPYEWECCATMNESWGYTKNPAEVKTADELLTVLFKTVSAGGNFLLNVGPMPDGTIPEEHVAILKEIAAWMKHNKEAIRGTVGNPYEEFFGWGYVTAKGPVTYLLVSEWEDGKTITLPRLNNKVESVKVLGDPARKLDWKRDSKDLQITLAGGSLHESATVIKVSCAGDSLDIDSPGMTENDGGIRLTAGYGKNRGERIRTLRHHIVDNTAVVKLGGRYSQVDKPSREYIVWEFHIDTPGTFRIAGECMGENLNEIEDRQVLLNTTPANQVSTLVTKDSIKDGGFDLGQIKIDQAGLQKLVLEVNGGSSGPAVYLKMLHLERVK